MYSLRALLLVLLLTVLQFVLSVNAKGGGKGGGSKNSKKSKSKKKKPVIFEENGKCYNEQHVEVECPPKKNIALILGIVIAVIGAILILLLAIWFFKRRSQNKKSLDAKSRGLDDASSDHESIMPLVLGETKEKDREYSYKDKGADV